MYWDLYRKQIKKIGSVWWLWIIFENGRRRCPCLNNLQQLWHISWSLKLFPGLVFPCKFTLTKDITSNQCCLRKFVGFWMLKNSNNSLEPTIRWDGEMAKLNIVGYVNQICLRKPMVMGSATIIWPWLIGLRHMKALD